MEVQFEEVLEQVEGHEFWLSYFSDAMNPRAPVGIHLAVFAEPFLSDVLAGRKTIESRFSKTRCAPYGEIGNGDIILLKEIAGPIRGLVRARRAWCYDLAAEPIDSIRERFGDAIGADEAYWEARTNALFGTLMELDVPMRTGPVACDKRDRRGWVPLRSRQMPLDLA